MSLEFVESFRDDRGSILVFNHDGKDYLVIHTKKGYMRGGEIHTGKQYTALLEGEIEWTTPNNSQKYLSFSRFITSRNTPHMMESLTDSLMLEWRQNPREQPTNYYEPYRKKVVERIEELA